MDFRLYTLGGTWKNGFNIDAARRVGYGTTVDNIGKEAITTCIEDLVRCLTRWKWTVGAFMGKALVLLLVEHVLTIGSIRNVINVIVGTVDKAGSASDPNGGTVFHEIIYEARILNVEGGPSFGNNKIPVAL